MTLPSNCGIHPCDVKHLAHVAFEEAIHRMADNHGFHERVVRAVCGQGVTLEQADSVLESMRKAAQVRGELRIKKMTQKQHKWK